MQIRWLGVSSFAAVVALALSLSGCGGGGSPGMKPPGDGDGQTNGDGSLSVLDKWRSFENGNPTLRMSSAQVSEAWRAAARRSTDSLQPQGTVSTAGGDPQLIVDDDPCEPGDCDIEWAFRPGNTIALAPVLEHNDVPVAKIEGRATETDEEGTFFADFLLYGGWLDHTQFLVSFVRVCEVGAPGCSGTDPDYQFAATMAFVAGNDSGTPPTGMGSARWTGVMVGMESPEPSSAAHSALLGGGQPDVFLGEAGITIDDLSDPDVDVSFTNIHNVTQGTRRSDMTWENLHLQDDGLFGGLTGKRHGNDEYEYIAGMFTGPRHQEVGGEFLRDGIAGAFGAKRR